MINTEIKKVEKYVKFSYNVLTKIVKDCRIVKTCLLNSNNIKS